MEAWWECHRKIRIGAPCPQSICSPNSEQETPFRNESGSGCPCPNEIQNRRLGEGSRATSRSSAEHIRSKLAHGPPMSCDCVPHMPAAGHVFEPKSDRHIGLTCQLPVASLNPTLTDTSGFVRTTAAGRSTGGTKGRLRATMSRLSGRMLCRTRTFGLVDALAMSESVYLNRANALGIEVGERSVGGPHKETSMCVCVAKRIREV